MIMLTGQLETGTITKVPENENDTTSDENSGPIDWPFTKLTTAGDGIEIDSVGVVMQNVMKFRSKS